MKRSQLFLAGLSAIAIVGAIAPHAFLQPAPPAPPAGQEPPSPPNPGAAPEPSTPSTPSQPSTPELPAGQEPPSPPNPGAAPEVPAPSTPSLPTTPEVPAFSPPAPTTPEAPALPDPSSDQPPGLPIDPGQVPNQEQMVGAIANLVIQKFQTASCEELAQMQPSAESNATSNSDDPQAAMKEQVIGILKANAEIRTQFVNQVAPVIANKMFDCKFIP